MAKKPEQSTVQIRPANMVVIVIRVRGTAPLVIEAFPEKVKQQLLEHMGTPKAEQKGKKARSVRNYAEEFQQARHRAVAGWDGIPAMAFRQGMIDACRTTDVPMTIAKIATSIVADGFDARSGDPLVRLQSASEPELTQKPVRNANGSVDIRVRPMWREWWADVQVQFDADLITAESVVNLLDRTGQQVGVGAGRPFSKKSAGQGWGTFTVDQPKEQVA
jgi:hypothetical protein